MSAFGEAWERRAPLHEDPETDAYRVFDGLWEGLPGWTVDRYASVALIQTFRDAAPAPGIEATYADHGLTVVVRDRGERAPARLVSGAWPATDEVLPREGRFVVREEGLRFGADLLHGTNTGLFLDARPLRAWVRAESAGRRVLNLFSYTACFGVAAAVGGARSVDNIDAVPSALERGRANFLLNGLPDDPRSHRRSDVFEVLRQARKRGTTWDGVVCDPPPVRTQGGGKGFDPRRDLGRVLARAWDTVAPGGWLLAVSAVPDRRWFEDALPEATWAPIDRGLDFPGPREAGTRGWIARR